MHASLQQHSTIDRAPTSAATHSDRVAVGFTTGEEAKIAVLMMQLVSNLFVFFLSKGSCGWTEHLLRRIAGTTVSHLFRAEAAFDEQ